MGYERVSASSQTVNDVVPLSYISNRNILLSRLLEDLGKNAFFLKFKIHLRLIRLDFHQHITRC